MVPALPTLLFAAIVSQQATHASLCIHTFTCCIAFWPWFDSSCGIQSYADALLYQSEAPIGSEGSAGMPATSSSPQMADMQLGLNQQQDTAPQAHDAPSAAPSSAAPPVSDAQQAEAISRCGNYPQLNALCQYASCQNLCDGYSIGSPSCMQVWLLSTAWFVT